MAVALLALILAALLHLSMRTSASAQIIQAQADDVTHLMAPSIERTGSLLEIRVIRKSALSIVGHDLVVAATQWFSGPLPDPSAALFLRMNAADAINAVSPAIFGRCVVVASAQVSESRNAPMFALISAVGDESQAWRYTLIHESAHCIRNAAMAAAMQAAASATSFTGDSLPAGERELIAANMTEAYADAYAILVLAQIDRRQGLALARAVAGLRESHSRNGEYATAPAIRAAIAQVEGGALHAASVDLDRLAFESALESARELSRLRRMDPSVLSAEWVDAIRANRATVFPS